MKIFRYLFKILIFVIISIMSISFSSSVVRDQSLNSNSKVIAEGILTIIHKGGTREIQYPSGYAIKYPVWIVAPKSSNPTVFLRTNRYQLGNFLNKKIHVEGNFFRESDKKISPIHFIKAYDKIVVDTIYCMN